MPTVLPPKFFLIISNAIFSQLAFTPPHPPPAKEERERALKEGENKDLWSRDGVQWSLILLWAFYHFLSVFEVFAILNNAYPILKSTKVEQYLPLCSHDKNAMFISTPFIIGSTMVITGTLIRRWCFTRLGKQFTFALAVRPGDKLITDGAYAIVRHPSYTGGILVYVGLAVCQLSTGSWVVECRIWETVLGKGILGVWCAYFATVNLGLAERIEKEEKALEREFKDEWTAWSKRTPYKLLPFVY